MDIQKLGLSSAYTAPAQEKDKENKPTTLPADPPKAEKPVDSYLPGNKTEVPVTYTKPKKLSADQLKGIKEEQVASFQSMLKSMLVQQGASAEKTDPMSNLFASLQASTPKTEEEKSNDPYSVDAVATRILDMAKSLSGGDKSKIDVLRKAVQQGFKQAGVEFGRPMPSITGETYNEVMTRFDNWAKEE